MPKFINTFVGGMDRDTVPTSYDNKKYYNARNFSIVVAEDLSSATLTNAKGVSHKMIDVNGAADRQIIGISEMAGYLIVFTKGATTNSKIYEIPFSVLEGVGATPINLNDDTYRIVDKAFNFGVRVECVAREETTGIRKIYWVDGTNPMRFCNLALGFTELDTYAITDFEINQDVTLATPIYVRTVSGNLMSGVYQYAYCLYNQNAGQTPYSSFSQFIQVTETGVTPSSTDFRGSDMGVESSSGIEISITDTNTNYDFIRVISLFYTTPTAQPEITIIYEGGYAATTTITHTGSELFGTLVLEEAIASPIILTPKTIATKYNYLFVGNIQETSFDVTDDEFDARTYRFLIGNGDARVYNDDGTYYWIDDITHYVYHYTAGGTPIQTYSTPWAVPTGTGNLNKFNDITNDAGGGHLHKYLAESSTLGGEGPRVSYNFISKAIPYTLTPTGMKIWNTDNSYLNGLGGYANPYWNKFVGYQRDEVYRFGIVFFNTKGQQSFVKWIGDVRFPKYSDGANYRLMLPADPTKKFQALGIHFALDFSTLPTDVVSYQIVRAERTYDNGTVVDCGYVSHLEKSGTTDLFFGGYGGANGSITPCLHNASAGVYTVKNIVEYICPETNYNKNNASNYTRLDVYDGITPSSYSEYKDHYTGGDFTLRNDVYLLGLYPEHTFNSSVTVNDTFLFNAQRSVIGNYNFDNYKIWTRSNINLTPNHNGYKGTTLVLKLNSNLINIAGDDRCPYVVRRRSLYPYNGYTQSALTNTTYYPCSIVHPIIDTSIDVWGGDTYISKFEYMRHMWRGDGSAYAQILQMLVESKLDLNHTVNDRWGDLDSNTTLTTEAITTSASRDYMAMWETAGSWLFTGTTYYTQEKNLYTYNPVYSLNTGAKTFQPKPLNFVNNTDYPTRVAVAEKKTNGEVIDSWLQFLPNNYIDLDNQFGDLYKLYNHNNLLVYLQEKGIGVLPVEDREVISTSNSSAVSIGTGGVLTRYDYITTNAGTSLPASVVGTESNLYFVDNNLKKICEWNGKEGVNYISDLEGMYAYMANADLTAVNSIYNPKTKEIHFNFPTETLTWNEYTKSFIGFSDVLFKYGIFNNGYMYALNTIDSTFDYVSCVTLNTGLYGKYSLIYPQPAAYTTSTLDLIINPARQIVSRFDIIELSTEVFSGSTNLPTTTFNTLEVTNNYQTTGVTLLDPDVNITRRFRCWRYNQLRNAADDGRFIDNFAKLSLTFTNNGTNKLLVSDVQTTFSPLNLR